MYRHKRKGEKHPLILSCCSISQLIRNFNEVQILRCVLLLFQGENRSLINILSPMLAKSLIEFIYYIAILHVMLCVCLGSFFFREWLDFVWQNNATNGSRRYLLIPKSAALGISPHMEFWFPVAEFVYFISEKCFSLHTYSICLLFILDRVVNSAWSVCNCV